MATDARFRGDTTYSLGLVLPDAAKKAYWGVVEDCLVQFHGLTKPKAHGKTNAFRKQLAIAPNLIDSEIIYHNEPFYVACGIVGMDDIPDQERLLKRSRAEYESMKEDRAW